MYRSKELPKTAAPDPNTLWRFSSGLYQKRAKSFASISSGLSSTYQSAMLARDMLDTDKVKIVDSLAASLGGYSGFTRYRVGPTGITSGNGFP